MPLCFDPELLKLTEEMQEIWADLPVPIQRAGFLAYCLHLGADDAFRSKYRRDWWSILDSRLRLSARQSGSLQEFCESAARKVQGRVAPYPDQEREAARLWGLPEAEQEAVIDAMSEEAGTLISLIRCSQESKKESEGLNPPKEKTKAKSDTLFEEEE